MGLFLDLCSDLFFRIYIQLSICLSWHQLSFLKNIIYLFIYFWMCYTGFCCHTGFSLVGGSRGLLFSLVLGLLITVASPVVVRGLQVRGLRSCGSGPGCSTACGILPDEGLNPCLLHWQSESSPLSHQGNPVLSWLLSFYQKSWSQLAQVLQLFFFSKLF